MSKFKEGDRIVVIEPSELYFGRRGRVTAEGVNYERNIYYFRTDCGHSDYLFGYKLQLEHVYDSPLNQELR